VRYPAAAPRRDPSLSSEGATANPWPSSDWVAFASERGLVGLFALAGAIGLLFWRAHQMVWRAPGADERLRGGVLAAVLAAAVTAGAFDAVLLLAAPSFLVWTAAGALAGGGEGPSARPGPGRAAALPEPVARLLVLVLATAAAAGVAHAGAMALTSSGRSRALDLAARLAPGDYRIQLRAAQDGAASGRCEAARARATKAHRLAPAAPAPARVLRACGATPRSRRRGG
jgi:hypothetical protein